MFRIRELCLDQDTVYIWVDGRLSDQDLASFRDILEKYMNLNTRVFVNLTNLSHLGLEGKQFLQEIHDRVELVDLPEYLKAEIMARELGGPDK